MKKVIVAGSRGFSSRLFAFSVLDRLYSEEDVTIVSGGACGADSCGEEWAKTNNVPVEVFKPDYERYKKGAPLMRNSDMAEVGDALVLFWDGKSRGSRDMLEKAYRAGIGEIHIYRPADDRPKKITF